MNNELAKLVRLGKSHAKPASEVLARAFENYPALKYYYPDISKRQKVNRYFSLLSTYYGIHFGEMYTTSLNLEGIAIWIPSDSYNMNFRNLMRSVPLLTLLAFGFHAGSRMRALGEYADNVHRRLAPSNHWYLAALGVDPRYQGKGYASKLVKPMLLRADQEKIPCYLETNDEIDVGIYRHFGFSVIEEGPVPDTTVKNWAMLREVHPLSSE